MGGFRWEVVGAGEHRRAGSPRLRRSKSVADREGANGGERVGVRGGRWVSELGRLGVARHWCAIDSNPLISLPML